MIRRGRSRPGRCGWPNRKLWIIGEGPASDDNHDMLEKKKVVSYTPQDIRFTRSKDGNALFAIVLGLPQKPIQIKSLATEKVAGVELLGSERKLNWKQEADALVIQPGKSWPCQYAVAFKVVLGE